MNINSVEKISTNKSVHWNSSETDELKNGYWNCVSYVSYATGQTVFIILPLLFYFLFNKEINDLIVIYVSM